MSRWATEFSMHPFQEIWIKLKDELAIAQVDDQTVPTSVDELARLKRVVAYLDKLVASVDPDLTPKSVWANFQPQSESCLQQVQAYASNRNIEHIVQANEHVDNLLTYLKPYFVLPKDVISALQSSAITYVSEIEKYVGAFRDKSALIIRQIEENKNHSDSYLSTTETNTTKINEFAEYIFKGTSETASVEKAINDTKQDIDAKAVEITTLYTTLLVGDSSTKTAVVGAEREIEERRNKIADLLAAVDTQVKQLGVFHTKIFGLVDGQTGESVGGLKFELDQRTTQLSTFEDEQQTKHDALFLKIESLLPGATSAGLASAYRTLKDNFSKKIILFTGLFYVALLLLVVAAIVMSVKQLSISPTFSVVFIEVAEWDYILKALFYKASFIAPVIWLAIFSSTRRSQYERLQQEYAHKEAFASSYESYKKQLQELTGDSDALQKELISKAIEAISYNASVTLDGKHVEKLPLQQLLEKLGIDDVKKFFEILKPSGK